MKPLIAVLVLAIPLAGTVRPPQETPGQPRGASGSPRVSAAAPPSIRKLDLPTCLTIALGQNPGLLASLEAEQVVRWRYYQQRAQYNPTVTALALQKQQGMPPALMGFRLGASKLTDENVTLNQTLYSFGRIEAGVRTRKLQSRAARIDTETARQQVIFDVTKAFYDVLVSQELIKVATDSVAQVTRQLEQTQISFEAGSVPRFDVVRAKTQLANTRPQLIRARYDLQVARQVLLTAMGTSETLEFDLAGTFDLRPVTQSMDGAVALAYRSRPELLALETRWRAARSSVKEARAQVNPNLQLQAAYDNSKGMRPPVDRSIEIDYYQVAMSWPLWDGGVSAARVGEARSEVRRIEHQIQQLKDVIRLEVTQALANLEAARAVIDATGAALKESDESLEIAEAGYQQGLRTNLEVLDAQLARSTARTSYFQAQHSYAVARARLDRMIGLATPEALRPAQSKAAPGSQRPAGGRLE